MGRAASNSIQILVSSSKAISVWIIIKVQNSPLIGYLAIEKSKRNNPLF
jgi:hypothetical protein